MTTSMQKVVTTHRSRRSDTIEDSPAVDTGASTRSVYLSVRRAIGGRGASDSSPQITADPFLVPGLFMREGEEEILPRSHPLMSGARRGQRLPRPGSDARVCRHPIVLASPFIKTSMLESCFTGAHRRSNGPAGGQCDRGSGPVYTLYPVYT